MVRCGVLLLGLVLPAAALGQSPVGAPVGVHTSYRTYAAGIPVAEVDAGLNLGPWSYQMQLAYHTTGLVGFFYSGHQQDTVSGAFNGEQVRPSRYMGEGFWRGRNRAVEIDYARGHPTIRLLVPSNDEEREPVPEDMRNGTVDNLSALVQLIHVVVATGRCDTAVRTFDGRRLVDIRARTVGEEELPPTDRSSFSGKALRCDFEGRMLAGFLHDDDRGRDSRPMHGSAWLARALPGSIPMPVRMTFETRWFGDATMYLTDVGPGGDLRVASGR
ncbi:MAG TPA: DUF3108 domain-containing protein [Rhodopila sp.]|nr:DUF3108 domain-containing protein [Rhodopila sp.]